MRLLKTNKQTAIALLASAAIVVHLAMRFGIPHQQTAAQIKLENVPLLAALILGGAPLVFDLVLQAIRREFGSDLLAGISIVTSLIVGEYLAGTVVVLMLSGGQTLESFAVRNASAVLSALAKRLPSVAHVKHNDAMMDVPLETVAVDDLLVVLPHEFCPVDGIVIEGSGVMDESYLTGEPFLMQKAPGSNVISGAVNGSAALTIRATKLAQDSRYAKIMEVMRSAEQRRPHIRRLADRLGAIYTPIAVGIAVSAWIFSGESIRFLSVLVVATPCPLLIAIPISIIGSISLAAKRGIIIKDPAVLEKIGVCRTAIFDKTGTLTYGEPRLVRIVSIENVSESEALTILASVEQYSRHPLAGAVIQRAIAEGITYKPVSQIDEQPGRGLNASVDGKSVQVTSRAALMKTTPSVAATIPPTEGGMECVLMLDHRPAALFQFRDEPRSEGRSFIKHLHPKHGFHKLMLVSGDRESEVEYLAAKVGITEVYASQSPEQKLQIVRTETAKADTVFMGDGINDAPALAAATVGIAFGQNSDITSEAAGVVVLDSSLQKVDELMHIGKRMRAIALQSAVGGMALSIGGMMIAASGHLSPVAGALMQEGIDLLAVLNALRAALLPSSLTDFEN